MNDLKRLRDDKMNFKGEQILLKPNESILIQAIKSADPPHSQRALALLALDEGLSLAESAQRSGLTTRQVRYWRDRF
ncbi:MAG: helix-turn-helix domain-containing protein, partial [Anaerolineales bacterium]